MDAGACLSDTPKSMRACLKHVKCFENKLLAEQQKELKIAHFAYASEKSGRGCSKYQKNFMCNIETMIVCLIS